MNKLGTFQKLRPLSLLTHLSSCYDSANLKISSNSVSWSLYLERGKITYASHSVEPFDRLERHLHRFGNQIPPIVTQTWAQLRLMFETHIEPSLEICEYQAICWLVSQEYLNHAQAATLIKGLVEEVIESFLLVKEGTYQLGKIDIMPNFCQLDMPPLLEHCQSKLQGWQSLGPQIWSPHQRPYFLDQAETEKQILPEIRQQFNAMLKGFSFYHLAVLLNQDELQLAQSLHPYIVNGAIVVRDPQPPFDQLPKTFERLLETPTRSLGIQKPAASISTAPAAKIAASSSTTPTAKTATTTKMAAPSSDQTTYTIVCVDDSPTMLKEISHFLDDESFSIVLISNPIKALMQIARLRPNLILLDVKMAGIDGYELCRLVRNHSNFKNTPIIMVTGNTGIIDRVRARFVGASGYLTKPFNQAELLKMVFKHLA